MNQNHHPCHGPCRRLHKCPTPEACEQPDGQEPGWITALDTKMGRVVTYIIGFVVGYGLCSMLGIFN
jgi:hypothetical protein